MGGGIDWGLASRSMRDSGWFLEGVVIGFVFFTSFAVLNIVNGVFVDGAIEHAKRDRMMLVQKRKAEDQAQETHLFNLLQVIDEDGDNMISYEEFCRSLERQDVRDFVSALQVDISDAKAFFALLDEDDSGSVDILEFVAGMLKLRGEAKSADIQIMQLEVRKLLAAYRDLLDVMGEQIANKPAD